MKWYFALNEASLQGSRTLWEPMITAAVRSAKAHTSLRPYMIYDGGEDPFIDTLQSWGVTIVRHRVSFYDALASHPWNDPIHLKISSGAFLRTEIPLVETEDEYVLYTDCDVLFLKRPEVDTVRPKVFACAPEFDKQDMTRFNTGVMVMNVPKLKADLPKFVTFIRGHLADFGTFDQDAYRQFYGERVQRLPLELNWKPYWGECADAQIVHFHGPKPTWALHLLSHPDDMLAPQLNDIFHWSVPGYEHYVPKWMTAAGEAA
jgi:hypothetical protein